jgi:hypothetical protein
MQVYSHILPAGILVHRASFVVVDHDNLALLNEAW